MFLSSITTTRFTDMHPRKEIFSGDYVINLCVRRDDGSFNSGVIPLDMLPPILAIPFWNNVCKKSVNHMRIEVQVSHGTSMLEHLLDECLLFDTPLSTVTLSQYCQFVKSKLLRNRIASVMQHNERSSIFDVSKKEEELYDDLFEEICNFRDHVTFPCFEENVYMLNSGCLIVQ